MKTIKITTVLALTLVCFSCKKLVEIPQPQNTITDVKVFNDDATALSAVVGIYNNMIQARSYSSCYLTLLGGLSADELRSTQLSFAPYYTNTILTNDGFTGNLFWSRAYYNIYQANSVIEGLQTSAGVSPETKRTLTGEAKFIRAFCHFYLVNAFGDVPLVTKTAWSEINLMPRSPVAGVYAQIIKDLKEAQEVLPKDYPATTGGEKIRPNYWAATALLARVYLYKGDWSGAAQQASAVINSGAYSLPAADQVFLKNSDEAIFQLQPVDAVVYATWEGNQLLPSSHKASVTFPLTDQLLSAFESGDTRRTAWVDSSIFQKKTYYYPSKYRVKVGSSGNVTEYYMVLRLAEQYLIRAEADVNGANGGDVEAINDLNIIRARANLPALLPSLSHNEVITAIARERRIELFAEWGHRWFDLKRTGQADAVLAPLKPTYQPYAKLWPVPITELSRDPNLTQNPGYN